MTSEDRFRLALELVSEGSRARVPAKLSRKRFSAPSFVSAAKKIERKARPWTRGAGIQGLGLGEKITSGRRGTALALRVYVARKKPLKKVKNRVPKRLQLPELGEVTTDVIEIGRVRPESFTTKIRPAIPGCGVSHVKVSVGTFGCLVRLKSDSAGIYVLSNSHVLANEGLGQKGDAIIQPADMDGGWAQLDTLGTLHDWCPYIFGPGYPNLVDAAIAKVNAARVDEEIRILDAAPVGVSRTIRRGMSVKKVGRTTDFTTGEVTDVDYKIRLKYKKPGGGLGEVGFRDQVLCTRFTAEGDSGAAVLNSRNRIVGLHFAGSDSTSVFNRIQNVFRKLQIELA